MPKKNRFAGKCAPVKPRGRGDFAKGVKRTKQVAADAGLQELLAPVTDERLRTWLTKLLGPDREEASGTKK